MNAIWTGVFARETDRRNVVVTFRGSDYSDIRLTVANVCRDMDEDGWRLESYELKGVGDAFSERDYETPGGRKGMDM